MNYFYKKSNIYFLAIPLAAALWVLVTTTILSANANKKWEKNQKTYDKAQIEIIKILAEDSDILKSEKNLNDGKDFDYTKVFTEFTGANSIVSTKYKYRTGPKSKRKGKTTRTASLTIDEVQIEQLTRFLTEMLDTWPDLKCDSMMIQKLKTGKDNWKIPELKFTYTY